MSYIVQVSIALFPLLVGLIGYLSSMWVSFFSFLFFPSIFSVRFFCSLFSSNKICRNLRDLYCGETPLLGSGVTGGREKSKERSKKLRRRETKAKIASASFPWQGRLSEEKNSSSWVFLPGVCIAVRKSSWIVFVHLLFPPWRFSTESLALRGLAGNRSLVLELWKAVIESRGSLQWGTPVFTYQQIKACALQLR